MSLRQVIWRQVCSFAVQAGTLDLQLSLDLNIPDPVNYSYSNMKIK